MKFVVLSDWRVQPLELIPLIIAREKPDYMFYGGDDLNRFRGLPPFEAGTASINTNIFDKFRQLVNILLAQVKAQKSSIQKYLSQYTLLDTNAKKKEIQEIKERLLITKKTGLKWTQKLPLKNLPISDLDKVLFTTLKSLDPRREKSTLDCEIGLKKSIICSDTMNRILEWLREAEIDLSKNQNCLVHRAGLVFKFEFTVNVFKNVDRFREYSILFRSNANAHDYLRLNSDKKVQKFLINYGLSSTASEIRMGEKDEQEEEARREAWRKSAGIEYQHPVIQQYLFITKPVDQIDITFNFPHSFNLNYQTNADETRNLRDPEEAIDQKRRVSYNLSPRYILNITLLDSEPVDFLGQFARILPGGFYYINGNDERPEARLPPPAHFLEEKPLVIGNWVFVGISGSPGPQGLNVYDDDEEMYENLKHQVEHYRDKKLVIISHAPPKGCVDLSLRFGIDHIGSYALRKLVENSSNIKLVVSGHSHSWGGIKTTLGQAVIINIANHDGEEDRFIGYYVAGVIDGDKIEFELKKIGVDWLKVKGIGQKRSELLPILGDPGKAKKWDYATLPKNVKTRLRVYLEFLTRNGAPIIDLLKLRQTGELNAIKENAVMIDIETEAIATMQSTEPGTYDDPFIASIAIIRLKDQQKKVFLSTNYESQGKMLNAFKTYISKLRVQKFSWTRFDQKVLAANGVDIDIRDLKKIVEESVLLPNYALKDVEKYLGIRGVQREGLNGFHFGLLVSHTLKRNHACEYCAGYLAELTDYNLSDVEAMVEIIKILRNLKK